MEELLDAFIQVIRQASGYFAVAAGVSQLDTPAPGPADIAAVVLAFGGALVCLGIATYTVITAPAPSISIPKVEEKAEAIVIPKEQVRQKYQYWEAYRLNNEIIVGRGITIVEAAIRVESGLDVMCANHDAALWLLILNGYHNPAGPEIHGDEGYFWHYHPNRNSHTHIWYY